MMGVFSRFSSAKLSPPHHQEESPVVFPDCEDLKLAALACRDSLGYDPDESQEDLRDVDLFSCENGAELIEGFVPVEYPMEPAESDRPVQCPQPEPCIVHDNIIWKEKQQSENEQGLRYLRQSLIYEMQPKQCMVPHMPLPPPPKTPQRGNANSSQ